MRKRTLLPELLVIHDQAIALRLGQRPAIGALRKLHQRFQLNRFSGGAHLLERPKRRVDAIEMARHPGRGDRIAAGLGQRNVLIPDFCDHGRVGHFFADWARPACLRAAALNLAALIEVELNECPGGVTGVEVEFSPELVQLLLAFVVQNQLDQRIVIAPVAHDTVVAGAQQTSGIG